MAVLDTNRGRISRGRSLAAIRQAARRTAAARSLDGRIVQWGRATARSGRTLIRSVLRVVGGLLVLLLVIIGGLLVGARFSDGPIAILPGGPFTSGESVSGPEPDWSFVRDVREVEFQLLDPARSRTTWILYHEGKAYIPCGYMTTWWGKIWKQWPLEAEKDPRILLRIGDALYERRLVRIQEGPIVAPLLAELSRKYAGGREIPMEAVTSGYLWLYELAPRG